MPGQRLFLQFSSNGVTYAAEPPPVENLVFKGGGKKGHVYPGFLRVLDERGLKIRRVAGTSAGALMAMVLALGGNAQQCDEVAMSLTQDIVGGLGNIFDGGRFAGKQVLSKISEIVHRRADLSLLKLGTSAEAEGIHDLSKITFGQLHQLVKKYKKNPEAGFRDLFITGTNITDKTLDIFSYKTTPDMPIALAARISTSIPKLYFPVVYEGKEYMDGACLNNYPAGIFDDPDYYPDKASWPYSQGVHLDKDGNRPNLATLGVFMHGASDAPLIKKRDRRRGVTTKLVYAIAKYITGVEYGNAQEEMLDNVEYRYPGRTVTIFDEGVGIAEFNASEEKIALMYQSGKRAAEAWFKARDNELVPVASAGNLQELLEKLDLADLEIMASKIQSGDLRVIETMQCPDEEEKDQDDQSALLEQVQSVLSRRRGDPEFHERLDTVKSEINKYTDNGHIHQKFLARFLSRFFEICPPRDIFGLSEIFEYSRRMLSSLMVSADFHALLTTLSGSERRNEIFRHQHAITCKIPVADIQRHLATWKLQPAGSGADAGKTVVRQEKNVLVSHHITAAKKKFPGQFEPAPLHIAAVTRTEKKGGNTFFHTEFFSSAPTVRLSFAGRNKIIVEECLKIIELARQKGIAPSLDRPFKLHDMPADLKKAAVLFLTATELPFVFDGTPPIRVKPRRVAEMRKFVAENYPHATDLQPKKASDRRVVTY